MKRIEEIIDTKNLNDKNIWKIVYPYLKKYAFKYIVDGLLGNFSNFDNYKVVQIRKQLENYLINDYQKINDYELIIAINNTLKYQISKYINIKNDINYNNLYTLYIDNYYTYQAINTYIELIKSNKELYNRYNNFIKLQHQIKDKLDNILNDYLFN